MKRIFAIVLMIAVCVGCTGCSLVEHHQYTSVEDYNKIFELTEIRYREEAFELFPQTLEGLSVKEFYFDWLRGFIGSASVQMHLSVAYDSAAFEKELTRLQSLGNGNIVHETDKFQYEAYASVLGWNATNYYALIDKENRMVHYMLLQIVSKEDIAFSHDYIPLGYYESGSVEGADYNIYEEANIKQPTEIGVK